VLGVDPARAKVIAFGLSSFLAGLAGAMYAFKAQYITVSPPFDLFMSIEYIAMIVLGGIGTTFGAVWGAIAFVLLKPLAHLIGAALPSQCNEPMGSCNEPMACNEPMGSGLPVLATNPRRQAAVRPKASRSGPLFSSLLLEGSLGRSRGGVELVVRWSALAIDDAAFDEGFASESNSAHGVGSFIVGVNWYLNAWVKLLVDYERTAFDGGASDADRTARSSTWSGRARSSCSENEDAAPFASEARRSSFCIQHELLPPNHGTVYGFAELG